MLKKRIIPRIIVKEALGSLQEYSAYVSYKHNSFSSIGTLASQLRILESNKVDELIIINADKSEEPISSSFLSFLSDSISSLKTPVTIGGGIKSLVDAENLVAFGADKLLIGINVVDISLIQEISNKFGAQAIVGSIDYSVNESQYMIHNQGELLFSLENLISIAMKAQIAGIGEILLNCMENDGSRDGFDLTVLSYFHKNLSLPIIVSSGAGELEHFLAAFRAGADAVSAGTYFSKLDQSPLQLRNRLLNEGVHLRK